jgi:hypothetical protein
MVQKMLILLKEIAMRHLMTSPAGTLMMCLSLFSLFFLIGCDTTGVNSPLPVATPHRSTPAPITSVQGSFVGKVTSTDDTKQPEVSYDTQLFIGFVTDGKKLLGCLTDGTSQNVTLFYWFLGEIQNGAADLQSNPSPSNAGPETMHVTLASDTITGTLQLSRAADDLTVFPNQYRLDFHATLVAPRGNGGVYRAKATFENASYTAGWVVLPDSQQRGGGASLVDSSGYSQLLRVLSITPGTTKTLVVHKQGQEVPLEHVEPTSVFPPV